MNRVLGKSSRPQGLAVVEVTIDRNAEPIRSKAGAGLLWWTAGRRLGTRCRKFTRVWEPMPISVLSAEPSVWTNSADNALLDRPQRHHSCKGGDALLRELTSPRSTLGAVNTVRAVHGKPYDTILCAILDTVSSGIKVKAQESPDLAQVVRLNAQAVCTSLPFVKQVVVIRGAKAAKR